MEGKIKFNTDPNLTLNIDLIKLYKINNVSNESMLTKRNASTCLCNGQACKACIRKAERANYITIEFDKDDNKIIELGRGVIVK
jgi:Holliday junction resolvasome RuvABC endonuclease subunit